MKGIRLTHRPSNTLLAEGPAGWSITSFEGNFYVRGKYLRTKGFRENFIPGFCVYKFLYVWLDLRLPSGKRVRDIGWRYWLPNPLFPFIWFRVALPGAHPDIAVESIEWPAKSLV